MDKNPSDSLPCYSLLLNSFFRVMSCLFGTMGDRFTLRIDIHFIIRGWLAEAAKSLLANKGPGFKSPEAPLHRVEGGS